MFRRKTAELLGKTRGICGLLWSECSHGSGDRQWRWWHSGSLRSCAPARQRCRSRAGVLPAPRCCQLSPRQPGAGAGISKPGVTAALVQGLWQCINTKGISPQQRAAPLEHRERTQEGTLPQQPASARPHSFQCSYNKGFDGAQKHVAVLNV